jgi:hypothetical protein
VSFKARKTEEHCTITPQELEQGNEGMKKGRGRNLKMNCGSSSQVKPLTLLSWWERGRDRPC